MTTGRERWRQRQELTETKWTVSRTRLEALKAQLQGQTFSNKVTPPKFYNTHTEATSWSQVFKLTSLWRPFLIQVTQTLGISASVTLEPREVDLTLVPPSHSIRQVKWLPALTHNPSSWARVQLRCSFLAKTLPLPGRREAQKSQEANKTSNSLKANAYNILKVIH